KQILPNSETDDTTPKFTVKVESHASLTIYDNGVAISMIEIGDLGKSTTWSFTLDKELSLGKHTITLMQKDAAGLTGEVSSPFTFYVVAPKAASLSETSVDTLSTEGPSLADSVGLHTLKV
ncbi:Ig-like domain-containing protein, partial [Acinetobacter baumannii]